MPLSKAKNRERMRRARATCVQPKSKEVVQPKLTIPGLKIEGNRIIGLAPVQPIIDAVSPSVRREGYGKASSTVITQVDADGNAIPDYDD